MQKFLNFSKNILLIIISSIFIIIVCELFLRLKHSIIPNYDIEMWKYSKNLKVKSENKKIGHIHIPNREAVLQKVKISINNIGIRGDDIDLNNLDIYEKKIMFIGSSMLLGWGVDEQNIFTSILKKKSLNDKKNWLILNAGVGNYNTQRYIENYFENLSNIKIDNLIIAYFINDTEILLPNNSNFFERNTHLGVLVWKFISSKKNIFKDENVVDYYKRIYDDDYEGFKIAKNELRRLNEYCKVQKIKCQIILIPHVLEINPYKFKFINKKIIDFSSKIGLEYYDFLSDLQKFDKKKLMNDYNDRHINSFSHNIIGEKLYEILN